MSTCASAGLHSPLNLSHYDRSPALTDGERQTLRKLVKRFDAKKSTWPKDSEQNLARLLNPLNDVLNHIQIHKRACVGAIRLMIRWMDQTQQSYWAWTQADWHSYLAHKTHPRVARPALLAFAYCLGCLRRFPKGYRFNYFDFASTIFGTSAHYVEPG